jgi:hypothetical protein
MQEPVEGRTRYLVHFSDGGSGMRHRVEPLNTGDEVADGGARYRVVRVEQPKSERSFGHAWTELIGGRSEATGLSHPATSG